MGVAWDFGEGDGLSPLRLPVPPPYGIEAKTYGSHIFEKPGTYFVTFKGHTQHKNAMGTPYARIENLARIRVIVE